jgi:hypothetical protein
VRAILWLLVFALGTASAAVAGQGVTAQVTGIVTDRDGGLVPGATVTITNTATGWTRDLQTGADGSFTFVDILAGTYDLKVALSGFKTVVREDIPSRRRSA